MRGCAASNALPILLAFELAIKREILEQVFVSIIDLGDRSASPIGQLQAAKIGQ
jgi:hypothetical protein